MIKIFRKHTTHLKTNWFNYALDTVVVIVGILIALAVNNWNEQRKQEKELFSIFRIIAEDLESDKLGLDSVLLKFEWKIDYMERIITGSTSINDWVKNDSLLYSFSSFPDFHESERGLNLLQSKITTTGEMGVLASHITEFYNKRLLKITIYRKNVDNNLEENLNFWGENAEWFSLAYIDENRTLLGNYAINNPIFRNKVAIYSGNMDNYYKGLKKYRDDGKLMIEEINSFLENK